MMKNLKQTVGTQPVNRFRRVLYKTKLPKNIFFYVPYPHELVKNIRIYMSTPGCNKNSDCKIILLSVVSVIISPLVFYC